MHVGGFDIPNTSSQKPLGVTIDSKMTFKIHVTNAAKPVRNYMVSHVLAITWSLNRERSLCIILLDQRGGPMRLVS